jgi:hypothetical protein
VFAGDFDNNIDIVCAPIHITGFFTRKHGGGFAAGKELIIGDAHLMGEAAKDGVVTQEISEIFMVGNVTDGNDIDIVSIVENTKYRPTQTAKSHETNA